MCANVLDAVIVLSIVYVISLWQEDGPPATGMSFYTMQQFTNYFILVYIACMLVIANGLLMRYSPSKKTIGQLVFGLSLVRLDGHPATEKQVRSRVFRTLGAVIFICIPGPIIALIIAFVVGVILRPLQKGIFLPPALFANAHLLLNTLPLLPSWEQKYPFFCTRSQVMQNSQVFCEAGWGACSDELSDCREPYAGKSHVRFGGRGGAEPSLPLSPRPSYAA